MQKDLIKDSVLLHLQNLAAAGVGEFLSAGKSLCGPITAVKQDSPSAPATQHALSTPSLSAVLTASKIAQPPTAAETAVVPVSPTPAETAAALSQAGNLEAVRTVIGDCQRCKLCARRTHIVFGTGDPAARLMFIGEGPGADEDEQGLPFVGRAGQLLTKMIQAMGLTREQVYIANIVKCLRYNAAVLLENGCWERISCLVREKYKGKVMSVDEKGRLVPRSVTGWHATPLAGRSVYKLTYRRAKRAGLSKCAIDLTGDHPVLTHRGYVPVENLRLGDRIATGHGFSKTTTNLIYGALLGDGHIVAKNAYFSFSHSIKQAEYARFKCDLLHKELKCSFEERKVAAGGEEMYPIVMCRTAAHRAFWIIREAFYNPKKRVPSELSTLLNPMMLAFWFMDDGHLRIRPPRQPSAEIATCCFPPSDLSTLIQGLKNLGLNPYVRRGRIFFDVEESKKLCQMIAPYVHPSMRYKLHPEVALRHPFKPELFTQEDPETLYDDVEAVRIDFNGTDKTFFCIDVEETNNFVTSGGVVHNCRPPENRNPEDDEIAACQPFLMRQIEIIAPRVIVCLGKFAAQTILKTQISISKLRGQFWDLHGTAVALGNAVAPETAVMPTYHPAFLLRNPEMKKPVWEDLKKVMERLKS